MPQHNPNEQFDGHFDELLGLLKRTRGFDFAGYKRSTLARRITHRMQLLGVETYGDYVDYLELHPEEYAKLFDTVLINVTGFFRDPPAWEAIRTVVIPDLLRQKGGTRPIRVWSAGCATGEEAYTLAMLFAEAVGIEAFREHVKIYATDIDEDALQFARAATYSEKHLSAVPNTLREKYFEPAGDGGTFPRDLRRSIIFGRNDLTQDAPISRVDLLVSRNTLMYFNAEAQGRILRRFHFAVNDSGYLFLGKAEMLLNQGALFAPVDLRKRIFRKVSSAQVREQSAWAPADGSAAHHGSNHWLSSAALATSPIAQIAVDSHGVLVAANARAEALFNLHPRDLGRNFQDLELSYRPVELRSLIEQVTNERRPLEVHDVEWQRTVAAEPIFLDVLVTPLMDRTAGLVGVGVSFTDVSRYRQLRDELEHANEDLGRAYEELQSTNEELETTNEELQSTNEELETTNEELQSTVEELETMNEELHSTNDELQEINQELRTRSGELDQMRTFVGSVLASLGTAVVVVNREMLVEAWSPGSEELWGLRAAEVLHKPFLALDIGLPVHEVAPTLSRLLAGSAPDGTLKINAVNRRGRSMTVQVGASPLRTDERTVSGVILIIDPVGDSA